MCSRSAHRSRLCIPAASRRHRGSWRNGRIPRCFGPRFPLPCSRRDSHICSKARRPKPSRLSAMTGWCFAPICRACVLRMRTRRLRCIWSGWKRLSASKLFSSERRPASRTSRFITVSGSSCAAARWPKFLKAFRHCKAGGHVWLPLAMARMRSSIAARAISIAHDATAGEIARKSRFTWSCHRRAGGRGGNRYRRRSRSRARCMVRPRRTFSIAREDPRAGQVVVHFPRLGFELRRVK